VTTSSIPRPAQPIAGGMAVDATWYRWLRDLEAAAKASGTDISASLAEIARKLGSPDGSIDGIPESVGVSVISPITLDDGRIGMSPVVTSVAGSLFGITTDQWGRVNGLRPVVAGAGVVIDDTTDPEQIEISAAVATVTNRITTTGDFRRTTQNDLRIIA
jgi:hypothetical protein